MNVVRIGAFLCLALGALASGAGAQVPTRPPVRPTTPPVRRDTLPLRTRADSLRARADTGLVADTAARANFSAPDSVLARLLALPGYNVTRYQSETIFFDALSRGIQLTTRAIVQRDSQVVKTDTIAVQKLKDGHVFAFAGDTKEKWDDAWLVIVTAGERPRSVRPEAGRLPKMLGSRSL